MILFRPSLCKEVLNVSVDKNGRFLIVNASIDDDEFCFVNIYAPNDQNQQITFYEKMIKSICCRQTENILIGGDFNYPLSASDKFGGKDVQAKKAVIRCIEELCNNFSLVDSLGGNNTHMKHDLLGETAQGKLNVDWIFGLSQNDY